MEKSKILGIIGSLILPIIFIFDRVVNHYFFYFPGVKNIAPYFIMFGGIIYLLIIGIIILLWNLIIFLILFLPYYYYSWKREAGNRLIKHWAKFSSIAIPVYFVRAVSKNISNISYIGGWTIFFIIVAGVIIGLLLSGLYLFAWAKRN